MSTTTSTTKVLTAKEYAALPDDGQRTELVRGRVVALTRPSTSHSLICANIIFFLKLYLRQNRIGRVLANDGGVMTERQHDTVRGPDVGYISYNRLPSEAPLPMWLEVMPEIIFEVLSPSNRRLKAMRKTDEFLEAGTDWVCIVDPPAKQATVFGRDGSELVYDEHQELIFPTVLPGFAVRVEQILDVS